MFDSPLQLCRTAAYVMNAVADELQLGNMGEKYQGDAVQDWLVVDLYTVYCLKNDHRVSELYFDTEGGVEVIVPDVYRMIRSEHLRAFNPDNHQIDVKAKRDFKGDTQPDLIIEWQIPEDAPIYRGERVHIPPTTKQRKIRVKSSLH